MFIRIIAAAFVSVELRAAGCLLEMERVKVGVLFVIVVVFVLASVLDHPFMPDLQ